MKKLLLIFLCCLVTLLAGAQTRRYVKADATGSGDGLSWANAYISLQAALDAAVSGDQIWVAKGTYKPSKAITPADPRTKTFLLKDGVSLYGGFAGNETAFSARNISTNPTVLSGDFKGDDGANFANNGENAYHVTAAIGLSKSTQLDGFVINGGNANNSSTLFLGNISNGYGGGLATDQGESNFKIVNVKFEGNYGKWGGGIFNNQNSPTIIDCFFVNGNTENGGGGIYNNESSSSIINCVFVNNAGSFYGAVVNAKCTPSFINCTLTGNTVKDNSGADIINFQSNPIFKNCIIWGNAGGVANDIFNLDAGSSPVITYSDVQGNEVYPGTGNLNTDPGFLNISDIDGADNILGTSDDGLVLFANAPTVNAGNNADIFTDFPFDIVGGPRLEDGTVNIGAYEAIKQIIFVNGNATGTNLGSSWNNAFRSLQDALDAAVSGDIIWVAKGTYKPSKDINGVDNPSDIRTRTFLIKDGIKLYGGFAGNEKVFSDRTISASPSILSGDFNGDDGSDFSGNTENAYHVTTANHLTLATELNGFVISGGNANGSSSFLPGISNSLGAGLVSTQIESNLKISNVIFKSNYANYAGGIYNYLHSSPTIVNCFFVNNNAAHSAFGIENNANCAPSIVNCVFANNQSNASGAIDNFSSNAIIINCTFTGNTIGNSSYGTALNNGLSSNPIVKNCIIWGNTGGTINGIYNDASSSTVVSYSDVQGGYTGIGNINIDPLFYKIYDLDGSDNIWGTADDGLHLRDRSQLFDKGNNADVVVGLTTDIIGAARIQNGTVAMGAYETTQSSLKFYVNAGATGSNDGTSWTNAFTNLQSALDIAVNGDRIWVAKGVYKPSKDINGAVNPADLRTRTFLIKDGIELYGSFSGVEDDYTEDIIVNPTILSGDFNGNDGASFSGSEENAYHVAVANNLSAFTSLDGFIIIGGNANNSSTTLVTNITNGYGGGFVSNEGADNLYLHNVTFKDNYADYGGGIFNYHSSPNIFNCFFVMDSVREAGAAIYNDQSSPYVANSVISNNRGYQKGAVLNVANSNAIFNNCTFSENLVINEIEDGAAITNLTSNPVIQNCIIWGNRAKGIVRGIYNIDGVSSSPSVTYSDVEGSEIYEGEGNILSDPAFDNASDVDGADNILGTVDDGLHLRETSPAADKGDNDYVFDPEYGDIIGADRIQSAVVNMGAYETVKQVQTITGLSVTDTKIYGDADYQLSAIGGGSGNPIVYTSSDPSVASVSGTTLHILKVGMVTLTASQAASGTYASTQVTQTLTVAKRPIMITSDAKTKVYGAVDPALSYVITSGSLVGSDAFSGSLSRAAGEGAGSYAINQGSLSLSSNYDVTFAGSNLTITKAPLVITADNKSKVQGSSNPALTVSYSGFVNGETSANLTAQPVVSTTAVTGSPYGTYPITVSGASSGNYAISYVDGTLNVMLAANNIKVQAVGESCKTSDNGSITITAAQSLNYTATISGAATNITKSFTSSTQLTNLASGTYNVCVMVEGDATTKQCFDVVVTEPKDLSVYARVNGSTNTVVLDLSGGNSYTIELNGKVYTTTESTITLPLQNGNNSLRVVTDKPCQGVVTRMLSVAANRLVYPNPFKDKVTVTIGDNEAKVALVQVTDMRGKTVYQRKQVVESGVLQLNLAGLSNGMYMIKVEVENQQTSYTYKIIKE